MKCNLCCCSLSRSYALVRLYRTLKMSYLEGEHRDQELLLPERLDGYISEDNPVRFIDAFVDQLDLSACGFEAQRTDTRGRPGYAPADMLKLYLYGYSNRTRSSRQLERACHINMEVIWLMRRLKPDHKTIAEFRRKHPKSFKKVFRQFVFLCRRLGLVAGELVAIDGTQLKAVNNPSKNLTRTRLQRQIKDADQKIDAYLAQLDDEDAREKGGRKLNRSKLREKMGRLKAELDSMKELDSAMEQAGVKQVSQTDPESRSMAKNPRIAVGYNAPASADEKHGIIVAEDLSNDVQDYDQLAPMARQSKENLGDPKDLDVTADKGYDKASQIKAVEQMGARCHVPSRRNSVKGGKHYTKDAFGYLKTKDAYRCPAGKLLHRSYESQVNGKTIYTYNNSKACQGCRLFDRCTTKERGRNIIRGEDEATVEVVRKRMAKEPEKYKRRGATIEKVFGTIKWAMGAESLLMKGVEKSRGEWSLLCACYNLKRLITLVGVKGLLEALDGLVFERRIALYPKMPIQLVNHANPFENLRSVGNLDTNQRYQIAA